MLLATGYMSFSQTPDDAIRQSYQIQQGTARNMAIGGAMGSLGGDLTASYVNPAGLGFYKTGEVVISPGFNLMNSNFNFRGTDLKDKKNNFSYGPTGIVFGWQNEYNAKRSTAISLSINQVGNFNNRVHYKGLNNVSSWSEQYLEELVRNRADTNRALSDYIFGSSLAYRTYLVDHVLQNGQFVGYKSLVPISSGVIQENDIETSGGIHEISLGFASNNNDKLYLGASANLPIYSYTKDQTYSETDATTNPNNNFAKFTYNEHYTSSGVGFNAKLGLIYKPADKVRLGIAIHTPTFASLTDHINTSLETNTEKYGGTLKESSNNLNSGNPGEYKYRMTTPWRALISGSYVFNEVKDVRKQKAFITADAEYVRHPGSEYGIVEGGAEADETYYKTVNNAIDNRFKGAFNFRLGGEVKFTTIMARGGFAYYGNPYKQSELKNNRMLLSGGLGYRNKGMFIDLTLVHSIIRDTNIPYYLSDIANTYATGKNSKNNVMLTLGFKF